MLFLPFTPTADVRAVWTIPLQRAFAATIGLAKMTIVRTRMTSPPLVKLYQLLLPRTPVFVSVSRIEQDGLYRNFFYR